MYGHAQPSGGLARREDAAYNSKVVGAFFGVLVTVCVVAVSAAVIVSAFVGRSVGGQMTVAMPGANGMSALPVSDVRPVVRLSIAGSVLMGPDGRMHDAFSVTDYAVHVGQPIRLVINNTDGAPHTITAPGAGVNIVIRPGVHTYTLVVQKAGRFMWFCALPCDTDAGGWAMSKPGFMAGYITAT
ncbi:MAG: hypothetical protein QOH12_2993 [Solirubrobacteraceae bacterium]|jgi:uncharacterized cupredoxin-like copper-binding protein|nr:hypothetical protein [Solirubrobacteraceae bacterium]